jgi:hypothetical protein
MVLIQSTISIVARRTTHPLSGRTARRIVRVCSDHKRGAQEIADALGTTVGGIRNTLHALVQAGSLYSNAPVEEGKPKPHRGDLYWADDAQLSAAEQAAREGHDDGQLLQGDLVLVVRGGSVALLTDAMRPALTAVATRWAARILGEDALWILAMGPDRDLLLVDQLVGAVGDAGGSVETFSVEGLLDGPSFRAYVSAATSPPLPANSRVSR